MATPKKEKTYEAQLDELEALVQKVESGNLPMEETLKLYQQGMEMAQKMAARLEGAQRELEEIGAGKLGDPPEQTSLLDSEQ